MNKAKELAPLTVPNVQPQKMALEYYRSKATNRDIKKFPEWDVPRRDPDLDLAIKKRILFDAETRLDQRKCEARVNRQQLDAKWKELEKRESLLRQNFIKYNKFVKENQEKRERAERKIADDVAIGDKRERDIKELRANYEYMLDVRANMEKNIKNHRMYEEYLQQVVKYHPLFKAVDGILDRYETLAEAKTALAERHKADLRKLEEARSETLRITEEKTLVIMGLNYALAELQTRYDTAKNKALQWEGMVTKIKNICIFKIAEIRRVREAAWYVYLQMCQRKEIEPELHREDVENQLLFIKRTLFELKRIIRIAKKRALKERK